MIQKNKKKKGFTLIELLVVVAIISLLTSVVLAGLSSARTKAQDTKVLSELNQLRIAFEIYFNENGSYPIPVSATENTSYCLGEEGSCALAGVPIAGIFSSNPTFVFESSTIQTVPEIKSSLLAAVFTSSPPFAYKPGQTTKLADGSFGFIYVYTNATKQSIVFPLANGYKSLGSSPGIYHMEVGKWTIGTGSNY